jgi:hypothetical protein
MLVSFKNRLKAVSTVCFVDSDYIGIYFRQLLSSLSPHEHFFIRFLLAKSLSLCPRINYLVPNLQLLR